MMDIFSFSGAKLYIKYEIDKNKVLKMDEMNIISLSSCLLMFFVCSFFIIFAP